MRKLFAALAVIILPVMAATAAVAQTASLSFFITSAGPGKGADLGGLAGADRHCQTLAAAVGAGNRVWRAYLSADASGGKPAVNARDRIGKGPWHNAKKVLIAKNGAGLHKLPVNLGKQALLNEKGGPINGRGDSPNMHDILTGTNADGTLAAGKTCSNWTNSGAGTAIVGHHDRQGLRDDAPSKSWNSSHRTRGCSQALLRRSGGNGFFYCFAAD